MSRPLCACPCHTNPGPGYEGHPSPGEVPPAGLVIGLVGSNGAVATIVPYCWTCAYTLTLRLAKMHVSTQMNPAALDEAVQREIQAARAKWMQDYQSAQIQAATAGADAETRAAVEQMMKYANEGGAK